MRAHACPKCGRFLRRVIFTHTGGNCPRCRMHIMPAWYKNTIANNRPWLVLPREQVLDTFLIPFQEPQDPAFWSEQELLKFLNLQMGLELPRDWSKAYAPMYQEPEYGPVDLTSAEAVILIGSEGIDQLHRALLIITGALVAAHETTVEKASQLADLLYYMATCRCVGIGEIPHLPGQSRPKQPFSTVLERRIRSLQHRRLWLLMDAVAYAFKEFDLPHLSSAEYIMFEGKNAW